MSIDSSKITLGDLDFDTIKSNLRKYLQSQSQFQDYDFEGSGLNILLDVLAYNTHYNAFYMNMIANEMFMDTASRRSSVVSHAKLLGYTPRSITSSKAVANVVITKSVSDPTQILTLRRFTPFISESLGGSSYRFLVTEEQTSTNVGTTFTFSNVEMKEGQETSYVFVYNKSANPKQIFVLPDINIDTSTIQVIVQKSSTSTEARVFHLSEDATSVSGDSAVYYLEETVNGKHQIYFGDDIIGRSLDDGNLVAVSYIISNGVQADGLSKLTLQSQLLSGSTSNTTLIGRTSGGSFAELIDDIKFSAPKSFIAQNRAVTKNDYISLLNKKYPYFDAVTVWGGEEEIPPVYGKVFISAKPKSGFEITQAEKEYVIDEVIRPISVLTVTPEFVDPDYNYLILSVRVQYDPSKTNKNERQLRTTIRDAVALWAAGQLNSFNSTFEVSRLLRTIDDSNFSFISSDVSVQIEKKLEPDITRAQNYTIEYGTSIVRGIGTDKLFTTPYFAQEDVQGISRECYIEEVPNSFTGIESIEVSNPGKGYTSTPTVTIDGDGVGATAYAVIVNGRIKTIVLENKGTDYTTAKVTITGGGGKRGTAKAIIQGRVGTLRSYYFRTDKIKVILNANVGTIDYLTGTITLVDFAPIDIGNLTKELSFIVKPQTTVFSSERNRLVTYDPNNVKSLTITLVPVEN